MLESELCLLLPALFLCSETANLHILLYTKALMLNSEYSVKFLNGVPSHVGPKGFTVHIYKYIKVWYSLPNHIHL